MIRLLSTTLLLSMILCSPESLCDADTKAAGQPLFARVILFEAGDAKGPFEATIGIRIIHRTPWYPRATGPFCVVPAFGVQ